MNKNKAESFTNRPLWRILTGTVNDDGAAMLAFNIFILLACIALFATIFVEVF